MDIILISIAAIVLLMFLGFKQSIYVFLVRIIYGEYSYEFIQKFKKLTNRKPHPYCFKDDFYYHILAIKKSQFSPIIYQYKDVFSFEDNDIKKDFSDLSANTAQMIIETFSNDLAIDKYTKNFTIADPSGSYLYFTDTGFFLSLKFFNTNNKVIQNILEHTDGDINGLATISLLKCD